MAEKKQNGKVQKYMKDIELFKESGRKPNATKGKPFVSAVVSFVAGKDKDLEFKHATIYEFQTPQNNEKNIPTKNGKDNGGKEVA